MQRQFFCVLQQGKEITPALARLLAHLGCETPFPTQNAASA